MDASAPLHTRRLGCAFAGALRAGFGAYLSPPARCDLARVANSRLRSACLCRLRRRPDRAAARCRPLLVPLPASSVNGIDATTIAHVDLRVRSTSDVVGYIRIIIFLIVHHHQFTDRVFTCVPIAARGGRPVDGRAKTRSLARLRALSLTGLSDCRRYCIGRGPQQLGQGGGVRTYLVLARLSIIRAW